MSVVQTLEDEITRLATIKMAAKIHSFDMCRHGDDNVVKVTGVDQIYCEVIYSKDVT